MIGKGLKYAEILPKKVFVSTHANKQQSRVFFKGRLLFIFSTTVRISLTEFINRSSTRGDVLRSGLLRTPLDRVDAAPPRKNRK